MKKLFYFGVILLGMMSIVACKHRQSASNVGMKDSMEDVGFADTTVYGVCGESTSMHNIELITDFFYDFAEPYILMIDMGGYLSAVKPKYIDFSVLGA